LNVLIVDSMTPFAGGDHDLVVEPLAGELVALGHDTEVLRIPISSEPAERALSQVLLMRWLEIEYVYHVIALGYPACLVRHERKTVWIHFENRSPQLPPGFLHPDSAGAHVNMPSAQTMTETLKQALTEARNLFVDSPTGQECLLRHSLGAVEVLPIPNGETGDATRSWATSAEELLR